MKCIIFDVGSDADDGDAFDVSLVGVKNKSIFIQFLPDETGFAVKMLQCILASSSCPQEQANVRDALRALGVDDVSEVLASEEVSVQ